MIIDVIEDLQGFLNDANLSTYKIDAYIVLLISSRSNNPPAEDISLKTNVPSGKIYEVIEDLRKKGMVEIIDSRNKKLIVKVIKAKIFVCLVTPFSPSKCVLLNPT